MADERISLNEAEQSLDRLIELGDERGWTGVAAMLLRIERQELWRDGGYRSFSAWLRAYASGHGVSESLLWKYAKAGRTYERARDAEPTLPPMAEADVSASVVATADKIAPDDAKRAAGIIGDVMAGRKRPRDVAEQWRAVRKVSGTRKSRHERPARTASEDGDAVMTQRLTQALARDAASWIWGADSPASAELARAERGARQFERFEPVAVKVLTEFPVRVETAERARRVDLTAVCVENQTTADWLAVALRGVEVKVSSHDLERDEKMGDYSLFFDFMYIAAPLDLVGDAADQVPADWGVLGYDADGDRVTVVREPVRLDAPRREEALSTAIVKLAKR